MFDPRDLKIAGFPDKASVGVFRKWRHNVEFFLDMTGPLWSGVGVVLPSLRKLETAFTKEQLRSSVLLRRPGTLTR